MKRMVDDKAVKLAEAMSDFVTTGERSLIVDGEVDVYQDAHVAGDLKVDGYTSLATGSTIDSVPIGKKIYCHPYTLTDGTIDGVRLSGFIFNQSASAFTLSTFLDYIISIFTAVGDAVRFPVTGAFKDASNNLHIASFIYYNGNEFFYYGFSLTTKAPVLFNAGTKDALLAIADYAVIDGVNAIN